MAEDKNRIDDAHYVFDFSKSMEENLRAFVATHSTEKEPYLPDEAIRKIIESKP